MRKRGKRYQQVAGLVDPNKLYSPTDAVELVKKVSYTKFDGTIELHLRMGVDPRHADQQVRGVAVLPHGTGKVVRVLVFAQGDKAREAEEAGADLVGAQDLVQRIEGGFLDFDITVATPDMMGMVGRLGKILGRRGLMPSPRTGTITMDIGRAIREIRAGRVEFRVDRSALIHVPVGKASFADEALLGNLSAMLGAINGARPSGAKGQYIRSVTLAPSMGPGVALDLAAANLLRAS